MLGSFFKILLHKRRQKRFDRDTFLISWLVISSLIDPLLLADLVGVTEPVRVDNNRLAK